MNEHWYPPPWRPEWAVKFAKYCVASYLGVLVAIFDTWAGGGSPQQGPPQRTIPDAIREGGDVWNETKEWAAEHPALFVAILITLVLIFGKIGSRRQRRD